MKKKLLKGLCLLVLAFSVRFFGQVGINTETPRSTLDVVFNSTQPSSPPPGLIAPHVSLNYILDNVNRFTMDQKGVIAYVKDVETSITPNVNPSTISIKKDGYYYFDGNVWAQFVTPNEVVIPTEPWKIEATGADAVLNTDNIVQNAQVGIGFTGQINQTAQFEIKSSDKGILIPRLTSKERDQIINPANSLLIFNTDTSCFNFFKVNQWKSLCGDIGNAEVSIPDCNSASFNGTYKVGEVLSANNYFQITLNVVEPGDYNILVNNNSAGFFFEKTGSFPNTGLYTIQIPAIGSPKVAGPLNFLIKLNDKTLSCSPSLTVIPADVQFNNATIVSADNLKRGQSTAGKTIVVSVDVINPGNFSFSTDTVNGVSYSASNINLTVGSQQVTLFANGNAPTASGTFSYSVTGTGNVGSPAIANILVEEVPAVISNVSCGSAVVNGILKLDVPLTASNYIDIPVTATGIGTYTINVSNADNPGFSYTGSGTISSTGTSNIRVYGTGTPTKAGTMPFTVTVNGVSCTMNIVVVLPPKSVLVIGGANPINTALNNSANFGINGKSKIEKVNTTVVGSYNATQLKNEINTKGTQVIIIGWSWNPDAASIAVLKDFIQNKKGFVFWSEAQGDQTYIKSLIDQTYGANVSMTDDGYNIYTAKIDSSVPADNPYINGVFGNAQNKLFRGDDPNSWVGITPATMPSALKPLLSLPSNGGTGTANNSARYTWVYGDGFLMCPDWGMLNYTGANYGSNAPISVGSGTYGGNNWDGTSVGYRTIQNSDVVNWVVFGNAMDYIFNYVQKNYNAAYVIP